MTPLIYVALSAACFAVGEYASKIYAMQQTPLRLFILFFAYNLGVALWIPAIVETNKLAIIGAIWAVLSLFATVMIGVLMFGEKLSPSQWIGIVLAAISVYLLAK
jgi:multidrug transporter EmrE-like cation transporter